MIRDVVIVGAGPGGLQAGIGAASEGLDVLILEADKVGGQIGQTPRLENFCFANGGMSGPHVASIMREQAVRMGVKIRTGCRGIGLAPGLDSLKVRTNLGYIDARTIILAMGNRWLDLDIPGIAAGVAARTVHYGPVNCLSAKVGGQDVAVYGGGPSGGQAIIELAARAARVHVIVRSSLKMPQYLLERIQSLPNVQVWDNTRIKAVAKWSGAGGGVVVEVADKHGPVTMNVSHLFMCAGLKPATDWLAGIDGIQLDPDGRVVTALPSLQTGIHGVYAIGDCRAGSTPRVGVAIGDGSLVVTEIWRKFVKSRDCRSCESILG